MLAARTFTFSRFLIALCLAFAALLSLPAGASEEVVANPDTGKPFATVWRIRGDVFASGKQGISRSLREGATVFVGEQIRAMPNGEAVLKTVDAGIVAVRPGAEFIAERYAAEGKSTDHQIIRLITGSLRIVSGWIARLNHPDHRVITPSATIGIRGTDHEPYVLPAEMATGIYRPGTYDKVNRGATSLEANGGSVLVDQGRVGFARDPNAAPAKTRAMMTLLLPTLLARVPEFYVPGAFDSEIDKYSANADKLGQQQLDRRQGETPAATKSQEEKPPVAPSGCLPQAIAEYWLGRLDAAIPRRDIRTVLGLFSADATARASVRNADGSTTTIELNRDEIVNSTLSAMSGLKDYQQRRISIEGKPAAGEGATDCRRIEASSVVIEQGLMNGQPYRFESMESYTLELLNGEWQATHGETTQR